MIFVFCKGMLYDAVDRLDTKTIFIFFVFLNKRSVVRCKQSSRH